MRDFARTAEPRGRRSRTRASDARGATFIAPYSTRARDGAPVAVPLEWDELTKTLNPGAFTIRTLKKRLSTLKHDPFERLSTIRQALRPSP